MYQRRDLFRGMSVVYNMTEEQIEEKKKEFAARGVIQLALTITERIEII